MEKISGSGNIIRGKRLDSVQMAETGYSVSLPSSKEKAAQTSTPGDHTEDRANEAREIIISQFGIKECFVMPLKTDNATDTTKLYTCLRNNMRKIFNSLARNYPDEQDCITNRYELIFILTSGTQQMNESARIFLPSLPYEFHYYKCIAPRYAQGEDRVAPIDLKLADEMLLLKYIEANVNGYYFHSVIENCERLSDVSVIKLRRKRASDIKKIFMAYESIDLMQYDDTRIIASAAKYYNEHKEEYSENLPTLPVEEISNVLNRQAEFLEKLNAGFKDEGENVNNLIDLCYNMKRAYIRGNYVDVLARFWRLREGVMNYRMLKCYCLDRRDLKKTFTDDNEAEKRRKENYDRLLNSKYSKYVDWNKGRVNNEINAMVVLLTEFFKDADFKALEDRWREQLRDLHNSRNQTIAAHGMRPVSKDTADKCMNLAKELIKLIPGGQEVYESYPFKPENMLVVLNLLKYI